MSGILAAITGASLSCWGQGTVLFDNRLGSDPPAPVYVLDYTTPAEGMNYRAQLYAKPVGAPGDSFGSVGLPVFFRVGSGAGYFDCSLGECDRSVPGIGPGELAVMQVRSWSTHGGETYEAAFSRAQTDASILLGHSQQFTVELGSDMSPARLSGMGSFILQPVPEPRVSIIFVVGFCLCCLRILSKSGFPQRNGV